MLKRDLEDKILEKESEIFDLKRNIEQLKVFEEIGDRKFKEWIEKYDKLLIAYKLIKQKNDKKVTKGKSKVNRSKKTSK